MGRDAQCHGIHGPGGEQEPVLGRIVLEGGRRVGPEVNVHFPFLKSFAAGVDIGEDLGGVLGVGTLVGQHHAAHLAGEAHRAGLAGDIFVMEPAHHRDGRVIDSVVKLCLPTKICI